MKKRKHPLLQFILVLVALTFVLKFYKNWEENREKNKSRNEVTIRDENSYSNYSGQVCAECRSKCTTSSQLYSSGDIVSSYKPYYLCGKPECTERRFQRDKNWLEIENEQKEYNRLINQPHY